MRSVISYSLGLAALLTGICGSRCTPENSSASLGALPKATISVTPLSGAVNTYVATAGTSGIFAWYWDPGDGSGLKPGGASDTLYYNKAGNYRLSITVLGHGGYDSTSQIVSVATNDPGVNVLQNSALTSSTGWTVLNTGSGVPAMTYSANGVTMTGGGGTNGGLYQAVTVKAGVPYIFSANITGSSDPANPAKDSWMEFYIGSTAPVTGKDYTDSKYYSMNTYSGCGGAPFNGNVVTIGCSGSGTSNGQITFSKAGTVYVVIKLGSNTTLGAGGVTVSNVQLRAPSH